MTLFTKTLDRLETFWDGLLYFYKHARSMKETPPFFHQYPALKKAFALGEYHNLRKEDQIMYDRDFVIKSTERTILEHAEEKDMEKGETELLAFMIENLLTGTHHSIAKIAVGG